MTATRSAELQAVVNSLHACFAAAAGMSAEGAAFCTQLFDALKTPGAGGETPPTQLPVCQHLPKALGLAALGSRGVAQLALVLQGVAPRLTWKVRASGGPFASDNWPDGHANALVIGDGGLEQRSDVALGLSLLAPQVRYPDHNHPPEELYLVLTPGRFQHGDDAWCDLGSGETFHNSPAIKHAMASGDTPLLALWTMLIK